MSDSDYLDPPAPLRSSPAKKKRKKKRRSQAPQKLTQLQEAALKAPTYSELQETYETLKARNIFLTRENKGYRNFNKHLHHVIDTLKAQMERDIGVWERCADFEDQIDFLVENYVPRCDRLWYSGSRKIAPMPIWYNKWKREDVSLNSVGANQADI